MTNPLLVADKPQPKKQQPANPLLAGIDEPSGSAANPLLQGVTEPPTPVPAQLEPERPGLNPFVIGDRLINALITEPLRDVSSFITDSFIRLPLEYASAVSGYNLIPPKAPDERVMRGAALVGSFAGGPLVEAALPVVAGPVSAAASRFVQPGPLLGRWGSFLTAEFLGGGVYGAIRPLDQDESRTSAVLDDAALFAGTGGLFKGGAELASRAYKRHILSLDAAKRKVAMNAVKTELDKLNKNLNVDELPPDVAQKVEEPILRAAIEQADPNAVNLDEIINKEADRAIEPNPRLDTKSPTIPKGQVPIEQAFQAELAKANAVTDAVMRMSDEELAAAHPLGTTPSLAESAAGPAAREVTFERRVAEHPVDRERRRGATATGLLPFDAVTSPAIAEINLERVASEAAMPGVPKEIAEHALMDAATDHAAASINLIEVSAPEVKSAKELVDQAIGAIKEKTSARISALETAKAEPHPLPGTAKTKAAKARAAKTAAVLDRALVRESPAAEQGVVLELTREPTGGKLVSEKASAAETLAKSLERDEPRIVVEMGEQVGAPWTEPLDQIVTPKPMEGLEIAAHLDDGQLNSLRDQLLKIARDRAGFATGRALLLTTGVGVEGLGVADDNLSPSAKASLRTLGAFLILAAVSPRLAEHFKKAGWSKKFILQYNPAVAMSSRSANLFKKYVEAMTTSRFDAIGLRNAISDIVPDKALHRAFMFAAEEGQRAPEWHLLSPAQQQAALVLNQMELRRGIILKQEGVIDEYERNYVRHLLPDETFERWRSSGYRVLPVGGAFTQPRRIKTLRDLEAWATSQGLKGPIMNPSGVYALHSAEADRALAVVRLRKALDRVGLVQDFVKGKPLPTGWRPMGILGEQDQMAPEAIASALENISDPRASSSSLVNSLDTVKSYWMRSIMVWPWEHGINVLRSIPAVASNPFAFGHYWKAVKARDPGLREAATFGADIFSRPDYGIRANDGWQKLASYVNLPKAGAAIDRKFEMMDRWLWEQVVPSLQYFAYAKNMHQWAERTGGKFLPHTPEYQAAGRAAAQFSNVVAGRVPQELANPKLGRLLRLAMFSPQWTTTRLALITHAAGELGEIAAGKLDPRDAAYLPLKMRQLAWGIAITWLGSKLMSGEEPAFNPNSSKFYMDTGLRNAKGKKIGLDMIGWWQTDLQVFNHPFSFMFNRLNPVLKIAGETVSGRDYLGRSMTTGQSISNILGSFGAGAASLTAPIAMAVRAAQDRPYTGGEVLQDASHASGAFNTATIPRPMDATLAKMAKRLLLRQRIPATSDNIFELSRILRGNLLNGHSLVDGQVISFLSYYRRAERIAHPIGSVLSGGLPGMNELWQESRRVLAEF